MSGVKKIDYKAKIGILHGAISNAGDFLIYERGKKLLENFCGDELDFHYLLRSERIHGDFDGLIILGGPLISRKIHPQSRNIIKYIKNRDIPCICIGLGISRKKFNLARNYFLDHESINFWRYIYKTSKLFSVRDKITYTVLKYYGIEAELTGGPALFNLEILEKNNFSKRDKKRIGKIAITIPNMSSRLALSTVKYFLLTLYFLLMLKKRFNKKNLGLFFQHGYSNAPNNIMRKLANMIGMKTYDISGKSLNFFGELCKYDVHIGTRLHSHIYFLSLNKPSFLLNVDMRTESFLKTIETSNDKYTIPGIRALIALLKERITKNNFDEFNKVSDEIKSLYVVMKNFLYKINMFYKKGNYRNRKNQK